MRIVATVAALLCCALPASAQDSREAALRKLQFLIGKWIGIAGEKDTPSGAAQGAFSFELQLDRKILVRRNVAEYSSGPRHDDLMIIYLDPPDDALRAIYFDSEGHVIRYNLSFPAPGSVVFESGEALPGPRYRLTYSLEKDQLNGKFEVAPPGAPYRAYLTWKSKKT